MARLGISIYVGHFPIERDIEYVKKAASAGFSRIFMDLLAVGEKTQEEVITEYRQITDLAADLNMEVILDVAPNIFQQFNLSYDDLSFFKAMNVAGIRLDVAFSAGQVSQMTFNKEGLKIELNSSMGDGAIDDIMLHYPNPETLITCHNFYPQRYTGLSVEHFNLCNEIVRRNNLPVAAFVSSQNKDTFGPWPVNEGLCTLEMHRDLPIDVQMRHLIATQGVDDIIIANAYASDEELETCAKIHPGILTFKIDFEKELQETERKIVYEHYHHVRGDMSSYMARSTMPRVTYADLSVTPENTRDLKRGDVVVVNDNYSRYKGEIHIVLEDMPNDGRKNVIGRIPENEHVLMEFIKPWRPFAFLQD